LKWVESWIEGERWMNSPFTDLDFERFIYRQGQLLASRDFRDQGRMEAARRWMHNSAMHNAWGVAVGYEFSSPEESQGDSQETIWELTIQPGIAYDCFGRELILPQTTSLSLSQSDFPESDGLQKLILVASYREPGRQPARIHCVGSASSVPFPSPLLRWKPEGDLHYGLEVPILVATLTNNTLTNNKTVSVRRYAASQFHPQARPRIASGQTVPGQTAWRTWTVLIENNGANSDDLGLEVDIDTSDAGFQRTPCYFAWLTWPLSALFEDSFSLEMGSSLLPFTNLANEKPDSFTFRVFSSELLDADTGEETSTAPMSVNIALLAAIRQPSANTENIVVLANRYRLTVRWLGIEGGSCENRLFCSSH
jgi:hypothetical protein